MATCSSILAWRIPWIESQEGYSPWGCEESDYPKWFSTHLLFHSQSVSVRAKKSSLSRKEERGNQLQVPDGPPGCDCRNSFKVAYPISNKMPSCFSETEQMHWWRAAQRRKCERQITTGTRLSHPLCVCVLSRQVMWDSVTLWTVACQASLPMGFPRQEYWSGLPFPPLGDLLDLGIKSASPTVSPTLQVDSLPLSHLGDPPPSSQNQRPGDWKLKA